MSLEDLIVILRNEEDNKVAEKRSRGNSTILGANIVEDGRSKKIKANSTQQSSQLNRAIDCRAPKKAKKKDQENVLNIENDYLCAMLSQWNIIGNPR